MWDNCSHGQAISVRWAGAWPDAASGGSQYNIGYRTPAALGRNVALPHTNVTKYLCGAFNSGAANTGSDVMCWVEFVKGTYPYYSYWCWYERVDPLWVFNGTPGSMNFKTYGISTGTGTIYNLPDNWYLEYRSNDFDSAGATPSWHSNSDAVPTDQGLDPPVNYGNDAPNPTSQWVKHEVLMKWSDQASGGYIKVWSNNAVMLNVTAKTDGIVGTDRSEGIGGYSDMRGADNWRYFSDMYHDRQSANPGRFMLANNATYASATIVEPQAYTSWASTSVAVVCNKGALSSGTVHLHYRDEVNGHQYLGTRTIA